MPMKDRSPCETIEDIGNRKYGYKFCIRYVPHANQADVSEDLTSEEAEAILDAGLALMVVQHVRHENWEITHGLGGIECKMVY